MIISCILASPAFVPISVMCTKQTSVSHRSTESEIISLDAGLRMDGLLALELWDVVVEVSRSSKISESSTHRTAGNCLRTHKSKPKQKGNRNVDQLSHVDHVTKTHTILKVSLSWYIFEDNKAVQQ